MSDSTHVQNRKPKSNQNYILSVSYQQIIYKGHENRTKSTFCSLSQKEKKKKRNAPLRTQNILGNPSIIRPSCQWKIEDIVKREKKGERGISPHRRPIRGGMIASCRRFCRARAGLCRAEDFFFLCLCRLCEVGHREQTLTCACRFLLGGVFSSMRSLSGGGKSVCKIGDWSQAASHACGLLLCSIFTGKGFPSGERDSLREVEG